MKIIITALLIAMTGSAFATPDPAFCEMVGSLARGITEDRDRGVSYNAELGKLKGGAQGFPGANGIMQLGKSALKTVYLDYPKITPDGAYKMHYLACMTAK